VSRFLLDLAVHRAGFSLEVAVESDGPWLGIVGPSGAGKSTVLDAVAGLIPSLGTIRVDETEFQSTSENRLLSIQERRTGYVFQGEALFPHLNVASNLSYGMEEPQLAPEQQLLSEVIEVFDLKDLLGRRPPTLSGGERRRVALGRALLRQPLLLLLDEPLTGLDMLLRERILDYLARCRARFSVPALFVSHQLEDVLSLTDHVLILDNGRVRASGNPHELLAGDHRAAVSHLLGFENVFEAQVIEVNRSAGTVAAQVIDGPLLHLPPGRVEQGQVVRVGIRAEDIILATQPPGPTSARNVCQGTVAAMIPRGSLVLVEINCGVSIVSKITPASAEELALAPGSQVWFLAKTHSCHYIEPSVESDVTMKAFEPPAV
jgi:molybdate transport system ATP-binding protein